MTELAKKEKMTIVFFSGTLDKAIAMMFLATTAATMNMDVSVFFTFWGLSFLKKGKHYKGKGILQRMMEFMMPSSKAKLPLTDMNMMGLGPIMMKKMTLFFPKEPAGLLKLLIYGYLTDGEICVFIPQI